MRNKIIALLLLLNMQHVYTLNADTTETIVAFSNLGSFIGSVLSPFFLWDLYSNSKDLTLLKKEIARVEKNNLPNSFSKKLETVFKEKIDPEIEKMLSQPLKNNCYLSLIPSIDEFVLYEGINRRLFQVRNEWGHIVSEYTELAENEPYKSNTNSFTVDIEHYWSESEYQELTEVVKRLEEIISTIFSQEGLCELFELEKIKLHILCEVKQKNSPLEKNFVRASCNNYKMRNSLNKIKSKTDLYTNELKKYETDRTSRKNLSTIASYITGACIPIFLATCWIINKYYIPPQGFSDSDTSSNPQDSERDSFGSASSSNTGQSSTYNNPHHSTPRFNSGEAPNKPLTEAEISNAFEMLGLSRNASENEVKSKYRELITRVHPDKGGNHKFTAELNSAKQTLDAYFDTFRRR